VLGAEFDGESNVIVAEYERVPVPTEDMEGRTVENGELVVELLEKMDTVEIKESVPVPVTPSCVGRGVDDVDWVEKRDTLNREEEEIDCLGGVKDTVALPLFPFSPLSVLSEDSEGMGELAEVLDEDGEYDCAEDPAEDSVIAEECDDVELEEMEEVKSEELVDVVDAVSGGEGLFVEIKVELFFGH